MAELKTQQNDGDVTAFLESVEDAQKRDDSFELVDTMGRLTGEPASMWGNSIVGFGDYSYKTRDGKNHSWFKIGFSPRKQNLTLYIMTGFERAESLLPDLGKHSIGKSCLYVKRLDDIDRNVLESLISQSLDAIDARTTDTGIIL